MPPEKFFPCTILLLSVLDYVFFSNFTISEINYIDFLLLLYLIEKNIIYIT